MLNELYSIYKGLEAVGEQPQIKHNDIQSPGMGITFRVMLGEKGQVDSVKLMTREQIQNSWSLGNGNKNQFPAVKVVYPLIPKGHEQYLAWKKEIKKPTEEDYRAFLKRVTDECPVDIAQIKVWPSYRKQVIERKEQLADSKSAESILKLFERYARTQNSLEILEQVAYQTMLEEQGDIRSLKDICTLLFGDDLDSKGQVKDGKRVTLLLDCFPENDVDIYASSIQRIPELSSALFSAELKSTHQTRQAECAYSGNVEQIVYKTFPKEKLNVIGPTTLFAKNATTSGPTVKRYDTSGGQAFPLSEKLSQQLAAGIAFINDEKYKDKLWTKLPAAVGSSPSLLLAFCKEDVGLCLTPLITGESEVDDFDSYQDASESVIESFRGKSLSLDAVVDFFEVIVVDKANRKINFSASTRIGQLINSTKDWQAACSNTPNFKLLSIINNNENRMLSPKEISPQQLMYLSKQKYIRDGRESTSLPGISFPDVMRLFLSTAPQTAAKRVLSRICEQYQPLFRHCALDRSQQPLTAKTDVRSNTQVLKAVTLVSLLLFNIGRTKEKYMNDFAFQLGQLCSAMDELHIGYCKSERKGDIPNTLLGNQVYGMALQNPVHALSVLASRRRPYDSWVRRMRAKDQRTEDKAITAAIFAQIWMSNQAEKLNEFLSINNLESTDTYKAELMLGYLAGRPFEKNNDSTNDDQGDKS